MSVRDSQRAIEPGSTESGDRGTLEEGLSSVLGGAAGGAPQGATPEGAPAPVTIPEDPMGALLGGEVAGDPTLPSADGLSVGPGAGPPAGINPVMQTSRAELLRDFAMNAETPALRQSARNELRRMLRQAI